MPQLQFIKTKRARYQTSPGETPVYFTDSDLENAIKDGAGGLIYMWSPGMVYSVKEVETFRNVAKKLHLKMIEVMNPDASMERYSSVFAGYKVKLSTVRNDSIELAMRNGSVHYPTTFVFGNGRLSLSPIIGVLKAADLEKAVRSEILKIIAERK